VEIETLRRYGRVPVGTRAAGKFTLGDSGSRYLSRVLKFSIRVGSDSRKVAAELHFGWDGDEDAVQTAGHFFRGKHITVTAHGLLEYAVQSLTREIEGRNTSGGHQHFKVIRAAWVEEAPTATGIADAP
jgi:hypothetical protein